MNKKIIGSVAIFSIISLGMVLTGTIPTTAVADTLSLAQTACPLTHCDRALSGQMTVPGITGPVKQEWKYSQNGVGLGLGATTASNFIAISFFTASPYLRALNANGTVKWTSGSQIGNTQKSAPLIDANDNVYIADDNYFIKFNKDGGVVWKKNNPARSAPFSFNVTDEGLLVGAGQSGPIWLANQTTGQVVAQKTLTDTIAGKTGTFVTVNSPAVSGNRVYVVTQFSANKNYGRLYALDTTGGTIQVAWYFQFGGTTGGSPLRIGDRIYFDGRRINPTDTTTGLFMFGVRDLGSSYQVLWNKNIASATGGNDIQTAATADPRGGLWQFAVQGANLLRLDELTGQVRESITIKDLIGSTVKYAPSSVMTIASNNGSPLLYVGIVPGTGITGNKYVVGINLSNNTLAWKHSIGSATTYSQLPVFRSTVAGSKPLLIVPTAASGIFAISGL
ncbi:MAG: hypothetical protein RIQ54_313 [Candidatus Parcubacteria bacterium]|jgi:hypothetical protein